MFRDSNPVPQLTWQFANHPTVGGRLFIPPDGLSWNFNLQLNIKYCLFLLSYLFFSWFSDIKWNLNAQPTGQLGWVINAQSLFIELQLINLHLGMAQMNTSVIKFLIDFCLLKFFATQLFDNLKGNVLLHSYIKFIINLKKKRFFRAKRKYSGRNQLYFVNAHNHIFTRYDVYFMNHD